MRKKNNNTYFILNISILCYHRGDNSIHKTVQNFKDHGIKKNKKQKKKQNKKKPTL